MSEPTAADFFKAALGERVYLWRLAVEMSRAALAEKADVSAEYIYRIEQGWANPRITTVQAIAMALETTAAELLDLDGEELGVAANGMHPSPATI
jgi:transcriptional regulator with XRE-family HTH domain